MVDISVVMPVRDAAALIEEQLRALADQEIDRPWELIVVNDGSTDATDEILEKWVGGFPGLQVVTLVESRGVAHARNVGTAAATGSLIAYCDGDDVVSA